MKRIVLPTAATAALLVVAATPAYADGVIRPGDDGPVTVTIKPGSSITIGSNTFSLGTPACSDGSDNDADGLIDMADPECTDPDDASERLAGHQDYVAPSLTPTVLSDLSGATSLTTADFNFGDSEICFGPGSCIGLSIQASADTTGLIVPDPAGGGYASQTLALVVILTGAGLPDPCFIGPIAGDVAANDTLWDEAGGPEPATFITPSPVFVPNTTCGDFGPVIDAFLGIGKGGGSANATFVTELNRSVRPPA